MFRKLISNLSFSPALIAQVSFYAKRLRKEEVTRRTTIVFAVLTLIMQSLAVFSPPESANASSEQDLIRGGVQNIDDLLERFDKNTDDIKDIYTAAGLTREEILTAKPATINSKEALYSVSRYAQYSEQQGEISFSYDRSTGGKGLRYSSPLRLADVNQNAQKNGTNYSAYIGNSSRLGWFAVIKSSASLVTKGAPSTITPIVASTTFTESIIATNTTQNLVADDTTSKPFDRINYTITRQNTSDKTLVSTFSININDALQYATLIDAGGGSYNSQTKELSWPASRIASGDSERRTFVVQILADIPATPIGSGDAHSYDCTMTTSFGTTSNAPVECPPLKGLEGALVQLPTTTVLANVIFATLFLSVITFFYVRTRQLKNEIRLIRHNVNTGVI